MVPGLRLRCDCVCSCLVVTPFSPLIISPYDEQIKKTEIANAQLSISYCQSTRVEMWDEAVIDQGRCAFGPFQSFKQPDRDIIEYKWDYNAAE